MSNKNLLNEIIDCIEKPIKNKYSWYENEKEIVSKYIEAKLQELVMQKRIPISFDDLLYLYRKLIKKGVWFLYDINYADHYSSVLSSFLHETGIHCINDISRSNGIIPYKIIKEIPIDHSVISVKNELSKKIAENSSIDGSILWTANDMPAEDTEKDFTYLYYKDYDSHYSFYCREWQKKCEKMTDFFSDHDLVYCSGFRPDNHFGSLGLQLQVCIKSDGSFDDLYVSLYSDKPGDLFFYSEIEDPDDMPMVIRKYKETKNTVAKNQFESAEDRISFIEKEGFKKGCWLTGTIFDTLSELRENYDLYKAVQEHNLKKYKLKDLMFSISCINFKQSNNCIFMPITRELFDIVGIVKNVRLENFDLYRIKLRDLDSESYPYGNKGVSTETSLYDFTEWESCLYGKKADGQQIINKNFIQVILDEKKVLSDYLVEYSRKDAGIQAFGQVYDEIFQAVDSLLGSDDYEGESTIPTILESVKNSTLYIEDIGTQKAKISMSNELNGIIDKYHALKEKIDDDSFNKEIRYCISKQKGILTDKLGKDPEDLVKKAFCSYSDLSVYNKVKDFDSASTEALRKLFENTGDYDKIKVIGTVMDFLKTGELLWQYAPELQQPDNKIDLTFKVANHFKAIEVFLCKKIFMLSDKDSLIGKEGALIKCNSVLYFTGTTLGDYIHYLRNNCSRLMKNRDKNAGTDFFRQITEWKDQCRNAYNHKDQLSENEKAEKIRAETFKLFELICDRLK